MCDPKAKTELINRFFDFFFNDIKSEYLPQQDCDIFPRFMSQKPHALLAKLTIFSMSHQ
jgi:hypothetical protein